jgi:serine/threonine-protein kinase RsbW
MAPVKAIIPSDYSAGLEILQRILDDAEQHGFEEQCLFAIKIAVEEAIVNAIKHGNKLDPNKRVHIEAAITPKQAEICIEDEGPGFDRSSVPDPLAAENLEKPSGRGILLIESYMNDVAWDNGGRRVRMVKKNSPGPVCTPIG